MPELPDLIYVRERLAERLIGRTISGARLDNPVVLRCLVEGTLDRLVGQELSAIDRVAHFLVLRFDRRATKTAPHGLQLAVNPMLAGRFQLAAPDDPALKGTRGALAFRLSFPDAELRYLDDKQMGKAYLMEPGPLDRLPGFQGGGVDVLSPAFTRERFGQLIAKRRDQVRVFLMDKTALDSLGNAYADEVLFAAGLHPKTWCRSLGQEDLDRLHRAIVTVLTGAVAEVARRGEPTEVKVRDFLKVRLKATCPTCGAKIRTAGVHGADAYFCPHCQPATRPQLVDWTRTQK
jgi:formamidopyrimidine-DNA glycosylase